MLLDKFSSDAFCISIFLNETIGRQDKNLIKRILWVMPLLRKYFFFITSSYRCFCFILGLFLSLATLLHTLQVVVGVDWCRIGCLWKEEKMSSKSLQFLIHLSKHCNWIVNKKTNSSRYINLDRASAVRCFRSRQKPTLWLRWGVEFMACGTLKLKQSKTKKKRRSVTCSTQIMQRKFQRC